MAVFAVRVCSKHTFEIALGSVFVALSEMVAKLEVDF